jgi:hypothetical protein
MKDFTIQNLLDFFDIDSNDDQGLKDALTLVYVNIAEILLKANDTNTLSMLVPGIGEKSLNIELMARVVEFESVEEYLEENSLKVESDNLIETKEPTLH